MGKPLSSVKRFSDEKKWEDEVEFISFPDGKQIIVRVVGSVTVLARFWVSTISGKRFPMWDPSFDSDTEEYDRSRPAPMYDDFDERSQKVIVGNCIVRHIQERGDDNPVRGFMIPHAVNSDLQDIVEVIKADPADPEKGVDLAIRYSSKAVGNKKWGIQRGDNTPMTEEEREYPFYDFDRVAPDFKDPEVIAEYAKNMRESMARHKYYVVQDQRVPEGARDPFKFFKGDVNGKPWTAFPVLVEFRNETAEEGAKKYKVTDGGSDEPAKSTAPAKDEIAEEPDDDAPPPKSKSVDKKPDKEPEPEKSEEEDPTPEKAPAKEEKKSNGNGNAHPDESIGTKEHKELGTVPECFQEYDGSKKCNRCPVRAKCIDMTDDDL